MPDMKRAILSALILAACATTRTPSVEDHRAAAEREREAANEAEQSYAPGPSWTPREPSMRGSPIVDLLAGDWAVQRHVRHAFEHDRAAEELERFEAEECRAIPSAARAACPLLAGVVSVEELTDGVRLGLAGGSDVAGLATRMRCHLAFARARGFAPEATCALYLRGVSVRSDGQTIELIADSHAVARELQRQIRAALR
jgi:hypothetical protein